MEASVYRNPAAKKMMKLFGMVQGWPTEAYKNKVLEAAKKYGENVVEIVKEDLKILEERHRLQFDEFVKTYLFFNT